jgi:hypothetical protein
MAPLTDHTIGQPGIRCHPTCIGKIAYFLDVASAERCPTTLTDGAGPLASDAILDKTEVTLHRNIPPFVSVCFFEVSLRHPVTFPTKSIGFHLIDEADPGFRVKKAHKAATALFIPR